MVTEIPFSRLNCEALFMEYPSYLAWLELHPPGIVSFGGKTGINFWVSEVTRGMFVAYALPPYIEQARGDARSTPVPTGKPPLSVASCLEVSGQCCGPPSSSRCPSIDGGPMVSARVRLVKVYLSIVGF